MKLWLDDTRPAPENSGSYKGRGYYLHGDSWHVVKDNEGCEVLVRHETF